MSRSLCGVPIPPCTGVYQQNGLHTGLAAKAHDDGFSRFAVTLVGKKETLDIVICSPIVQKQLEKDLAPWRKAASFSLLLAVADAPQRNSAPLRPS